MNILVADDDAVTRTMLRGMLENLGHEVVEAEDGNAAWAAIHQEDAAPLIILDWVMPAPTGIDICKSLRGSNRRPYQYVIMLTGRDAVEDVVEGLDSGADDYLRKPFDARELRSRIRAGERMLALQDELRSRARTDELTGLLNRRGILERLEREVSLVHRAGAVAVLMLDIDRFKTVNDTHGHAVGDQVLMEVAARMKAQLRAYDDIGRYGGEEFAIVLPNCAGADAEKVAERVRRAVCESPVVTSAGAVNVSVSVGVASASTSCRLSPQDVISLADAGLYKAKGAGRNRVVVVAPSVAQTS
jgi:two-component system cell cycle response regulator